MTLTLHYKTYSHPPGSPPKSHSNRPHDRLPQRTLLLSQPHLHELDMAQYARPPHRRAVMARRLVPRPHRIPVLRHHLQDKTTEALRKLSPETGAYFNEADSYEVDWQKSFFGEKYEMLKRIKERYDPGNAFWCRRCVGSEVLEDMRNGGGVVRGMGGMGSRKEMNQEGWSIIILRGLERCTLNAVNYDHHVAPRNKRFSSSMVRKFSARRKTQCPSCLTFAIASQHHLSTHLPHNTNPNLHLHLHLPSSLKTIL